MKKIQEDAVAIAESGDRNYYDHQEDKGYARIVQAGQGLGVHAGNGHRPQGRPHYTVDDLTGHELQNYCEAALPCATENHNAGWDE